MEFDSQDTVDLFIVNLLFVHIGRIKWILTARL